MAVSKVAEIVTDRLIRKINEQKRLPWQKPYVEPCINWYSKTEYKGVNRLLLGGGEYITANQLKKYNEAKGTNFWFDKGTESEIVVFYSPTEKKLDDEKAEEIRRDGISTRDTGKIFEKDGVLYRRSWVLKYYTVYEIGKIYDRKTNEKLEPRLGNTIIEEHVGAEELINTYCKGTGVTIHEDSKDCPYYTERRDSVHTPLKRNFRSSEAYYRVLFHELIHSTGIATRLDRECFKKYQQGTKERSKEELIAEVGAVLLASECGFREEHLDDNSDAYVSGWCAWMKDNPNELLNGMLSAEKAKAFIMDGGKKVVDDDSAMSESKI